MDKEQRYPMKVAAMRSRLSPHVIRIWEKRYKAVVPTRTPTNRRLYSEGDIERLSLLRRATQAGYSIGHIATLPLDSLKEIVARETDAALQPVTGRKPRTGKKGDRKGSSTTAMDIDLFMVPVGQLNAGALEANLARAALSMSRTALINEVIVPLMQEVGDRWYDGSLRIVHEHLASAVVRTFLGNLLRPSETAVSAPHIVLATPAGQLHEIGALIAAGRALAEGWRVTYLGPNLPAEEIAAAAVQSQARAVGLSLIYPPDDPLLAEELAKLKSLLPSEVALLVSGKAADSYRDVIGPIGGIIVRDLDAFCARLKSLREPPLTD